MALKWLRFDDHGRAGASADKTGQIKKGETMSRSTTVAVLALTIIGGAIFASAHAAPPTVTPSPGYDARLREQRKAASTTLTADPPLLPANPPVARRHHHGRRTHTR